MSDGGYDLSATEAAQILGVHPATVKRWVRAKRITAFRTPGGWLRFRRADLEQFLKDNAA
jgi:excisionase family DNA binding protein